MRLVFLIINVLFWLYFVAVCLLLYPIAFVIKLLTKPFDPNYRALQQFSCFWSSLYIWPNPFWAVKVSGRENVDRHKAYVMVSNHASMADILLVFRTFLHFKWVAKIEMFRTPLIGWNMKLNEYVAIKRGDPESREECMAQCRQWLAKGSSMFFFPEGTRSKDGRLKAFKKGAFRLALETGSDILPMVIRGSHDAIPKHSLILHRKSRMSIEILPPISIADYDASRLEDEAERLAAHVHDTIAQALATPVSSTS